MTRRGPKRWKRSARGRGARPPVCGHSTRKGRSRCPIARLPNRTPAKRLRHRVAPACIMPAPMRRKTSSMATPAQVQGVTLTASRLSSPLMACRRPPPSSRESRPEGRPESSRHQPNADRPKHIAGRSDVEPCQGLARRHINGADGLLFADVHDQSGLTWRNERLCWCE